MGPEADNSHPSIIKVKNEWSYTSISSCTFSILTLKLLARKVSTALLKVTEF